MTDSKMEEFCMDSSEYIRQLITAGTLAEIASRTSYDSALGLLQSRIERVQKANTKLVLIVGGAASGKTTLAKRLAERLSSYSSVVISTDDFVIGTRDYRRTAFAETDPLSKYDFDFLNRKIEEISALGPGDKVVLPVYSEKTGEGIPLEVLKAEMSLADCRHIRKLVGPVDLVIIEGDFQPRQEVDYIVYMHVPDEIRLRNRIERDVNQRGYRTVQAVIHNFTDRQRNQHFPYTLRVARKADILLWAILFAPAQNLTDYLFDMYEAKSPR